jgi:hypothetical protein
MYAASDHACRAKIGLSIQHSKLPCRPIQFRKIPLQKSCIWKPLAYLCIWIGICVRARASWIRINIYVCACVCIKTFVGLCVLFVSNAIAKHIWMEHKRKWKGMKGGPRNTRAPFAYVQILLSFFFFFFFVRSFFLFSSPSLFFFSSSHKFVWFVHAYSASSTYKRRGERRSPIILKAMQNVR